MPKGSDPAPSGGPPEQATAAEQRDQAHKPPALSAERHRKPDGRLLILYHWAGKDG